MSNQPYDDQPRQSIQSIPASSASKWKQPAIIGGTIGLSILVAALVLKSQTNAPTIVATPATTLTAETAASPAAKANSLKSAKLDTKSDTKSAANSEAQKAEAPETTAEAPERVAEAEKSSTPPMSAEEAAKAEAGTDATIVGDAGSKNVRSGPGTSYETAHKSYPGDRVKILATSRDDGGFTWQKIYFPKSGAEGWMAAQFLRPDDGSKAPVDSSPRSTEETPSAKSPDVTNASITGEPGSKNIRSGPGTNYASPHMAYPGDRVKITSTTQDKNGYTWYKVYFPKSGAEGWIAAQLVSPD